MKHYELLRSISDSLQVHPELRHITLVQPAGVGRFPWRGKLVCVNRAGDRVYRVPIKNILASLAKAL